MQNRNWASIIYFVLGFGIFMFTRRSEIFPTIHIAIVIAPVFIWLTLLGFLLSLNIALWGLFDISSSSVQLIFDLIRSSLLAILYFIPFMIDRIVYPRFQNNAILSTLTFPIAMTAMLFLSSIEGPFDGEVGKSIYFFGDIAIRQLASVAGLWGFVFILSWESSLINHIWENSFQWKRVWKASAVFGATLMAVYIYGIMALTSSDKNANTVKIAAIILYPENGKTVPMEMIFNEKLTSDFERTLDKIEKLTTEAAANDARLVSFHEFTIIIFENDENLLKERCSGIAKENGVFLNITYGLFKEQGKGRNRQLLFDDLGKLRIEYDKRFLVGIGPFGETRVFEKGKELIQTADTPFGRVGISTCRDMSFASYIRQAGKQNVDIMLGPSYDWPQSKGPSYIMRAIENGFSFIRTTYNGYTFTEDFNGRVLDKMPFEKSHEGIMYSEIPTSGRSTIYASIGDLFAWICVLSTLGMIISTFTLSKRKT